ncbi:unnamed protein product [Rangifer tarandus platyrhynchus]
MARSPKRLHVTKEGEAGRGRGLEAPVSPALEVGPGAVRGREGRGLRRGASAREGCGCLRPCSAREDESGASRPGRLPTQSQAARPSGRAGRYFSCCPSPAFAVPCALGDENEGTMPDLRGGLGVRPQLHQLGAGGLSWQVSQGELG